MKKSTFFVTLFIFIGLLLGACTLYREMKVREEPSYREDVAGEDSRSDLMLTTPIPNTPISSPVSVVGKLRGGWFFEAVLPIDVIDGNGKIIGQGSAQATTEWTTTDYVSFTANISFEKPTTTKGFILIKKDNPSGLPENEASFAVPVLFQ